MKNNKMVVYKENIFVRISNFFKRLFHLDKGENTSVNVHSKSDSLNEKNDEIKKTAFINEIVVKEDEELKSLKELQLKYESGEISEDDLTVEEMDKLIKMYQDETEELNKDTERIKNRIAKILKQQI